MMKSIIFADKLVCSGGGAEKGFVGEKKVCFFRKGVSEGVAEVPLPSSPPGEWGLRITLKLLAGSAADETADVFSSEIVCGGERIKSAPVQSFVNSKDEEFRFVTLESFLLPLPCRGGKVFITRRTNDGADTFQEASALMEVCFEFLPLPATGIPVETSPGYNSWPMCQTLNEKIVCAYSRGSQHDIFEPHRAVYARVSDDRGVSWSREHLVCNTPGRGDVTVGKGLDEKGDMLLFVRHAGDDGFRHRLYRTSDGINFELLCDMELPLDLVQITDIFHIPGQGLAALCFGGSYGPAADKYWGKLVSADNGRTWTFTVIEKDLDKNNWPTEPSAVYIGDGKILALARTESHKDSTETAHFQLTSPDYGRTWRKERTNITDVNISTPSLLYSPESGEVCCYSFYRGRGILNCRKADAGYIFDHPRNWFASEIVTTGSKEVCEAGNVNAVQFGKKHLIAYYSGALPDTAVYVKIGKVFQE